MIARELNSLASVLDFWNNIFDDDIVQIIVEHTKTKVTDSSVLYGSNSLYANHTNDVEIKALIG